VKRIFDTNMSVLELGNIRCAPLTADAHERLHGDLYSNARANDARMQRFAMSELQNRK
jgi:hypothetical protein